VYSRRACVPPDCLAAVLFGGAGAAVSADSGVAAEPETLTERERDGFSVSAADVSVASGVATDPEVVAEPEVAADPEVVAGRDRFDGAGGEAGWTGTTGAGV
jgi:hypothetical protein